MLLQLGKYSQPKFASLLIGQDFGDKTAQLAQLSGQLPGFDFKGRDLGFVGPSQYISAAIIQTMTVVLFMTFTRRLDLARARDRPCFTAELFLGAAANHVEAVCDLALKPVIEGRIRLDRQLPGEGIGLQSGQLAPHAGPDPEEHKSSPEVCSVDPFHDRRVMRVRYQQ